MQSVENVQHTVGKRSLLAFQWYVVHSLQMRITEAVEQNVNSSQDTVCTELYAIQYASQVTGVRASPVTCNAMNQASRILYR